MKKRILIVDDDKDILEPLSLLLETEGYEVKTTLKGVETYSKVAEFKPDLILLDVLMSGSDGRVICQNLKNKEETKRIPVIMMSAHPAAKVESVHSKANGFIAKPFEIDRLFKLISEHIKNS